MSNFKRLRLEAGYDKIVDLSRDSGIPYVTLTTWENGSTIPTLESVSRLCDFYSAHLGREINVYDLFSDVLEAQKNKPNEITN